MKELICSAFCNELEIHQFKDGYAVSAPYLDDYGDRLGFYILGSKSEGYKIIDSGTIVPQIEASGATLDSPQRSNAINSMLKTYGAEFDKETRHLTINFISEKELARSCLNFVALLLRIQDLLLMTRERVANTFRDDVISDLTKKLNGRADIRIEEQVSPELSDVIPDMVMRASSRVPVALFIITSNSKINEAVILQMEAALEIKQDIKVVAIIEEDSSVTAKYRQRADNRLDAVPRYRSDEMAAINRVIKEVVGAGSTLH